ncbi:MAG: class I SAM-dependent methyltransferase [Deltaproteobacteria bacterium]|nr:class I SAM-dependent methyltransferase [Deltaproteobacteria bacterium]
MRNSSCPLCFSQDHDAFFSNRDRDYLRCPLCHLVFVPPEQFLSAEEEKDRYDSHRNSSDDPRYRLFLSRLFTPMQDRLDPGSCGLDFGSGPGPTLSVMFEEVGHTMSLYDPFYAPDQSALENKYDFITATEVVEHLHQPEREFSRLWGCLKPGGFLGIMTKLVIDRDAFSCWHYIRDPTHVCFFSQETFTWLAQQWQAELTFSGNDAIIMHKKKT